MMTMMYYIVGLDQRRVCVGKGWKLDQRRKNAVVGAEGRRRIDEVRGDCKRQRNRELKKAKRMRLAHTSQNAA